MTRLYTHTPGSPTCSHDVEVTAACSAWPQIVPITVRRPSNDFLRSTCCNPQINQQGAAAAGSPGQAGACHATWCRGACAARGFKECSSHAKRMLVTRPSRTRFPQNSSAQGVLRHRRQGPFHNRARLHLSPQPPQSTSKARCPAQPPSFHNLWSSHVSSNTSFPSHNVQPETSQKKISAEQHHHCG